MKFFRGKVLLIANVASKCGLTNKHYTWFKEILDKYHAKGLEIALFPCNQFRGQEPKSEADIREFVMEKYNFEPDLYTKINVNGSNADPLFEFLKYEQGDGAKISWNFGKFLVNREGKVVGRFDPRGDLAGVEVEIEKIL